MDDSTLEHSLTSHLQQAHAMERAQLAELRALADEMEVPAVAALLSGHLEETRRHGDRVESRLEELGSSNSLRLLAQTFGAAIPKLVVDRMRPDDALAVLRDAVVAEATEIAGYLLLETEAIRAGDDSTAVLASEIRSDEVAMRDELMTFSNQAADHAIAALARAEGIDEGRAARQLLVDHLRDAHSLERSAVLMLATSARTVRDELATSRIEDHRAATQRHADAVAWRLQELGSGPSLRKQAQGLATAVLKGPFSFVRAERAAKDLRDMYVVEHLELVAYAQLEAIAERAGDERTLQLAQAHAAEEAAMADWLEREGARFLLESLSAARA